MTLIYSSAAQDDLDEIASYTTEHWGDAQADRYLAELEDCCALLVNNPELGQRQEVGIKHLRRLLQGRHAIYYVLQSSDVLILRILHQRVLPARHEFRAGSTLGDF